MNSNVTGVCISRMIVRRTARILRAENARTGMKMIKTAEISAGKEVATMEEITSVEIIAAEMMAAEIAPSWDIRSSRTTGRIAFSILIAGISMQMQQKSFSMNKHMGPTRSTRTFTSTVLKRVGEDITMGQDPDSKAVAVGAAAEEGTKGDVIFKAAGVEAEGGTRIKGTTSKEINRGTTIKEIINSKATSTTTVIIMVKVGAMPRGRLRDKVKAIFVEGTAILPREEVIKMQRGIILNCSRLGLAHWAILGLAGAIM